MDDAEIIVGRAALVNVTDISSDSTNSTTTVTANSTTSSSYPSSSASASASSSSHDVAIGAGVGVPLGIIAIGTLVWALWERRRANKLSRSLGSKAAGYGGYASNPSTTMTKSSAPTELESHRAIPELMTRE
ncbi:hypothetical protein N7486_002490 [Penicillium sp. IBT 16267x]|nr:hypothetical protein N7486_002490 [Penicillium sp. IBT 16267x]